MAELVEALRRMREMARPDTIHGFIFMVWIAPDGSVWTAPLGTPYPVPGQPVPAAWIMVEI